MSIDLDRFGFDSNLKTLSWGPQATNVDHILLETNTIRFSPNTIGIERVGGSLIGTLRRTTVLDTRGVTSLVRSGSWGFWSEPRKTSLGKVWNRNQFVKDRFGSSRFGPVQRSVWFGRGGETQTETQICRFTQTETQIYRFTQKFTNKLYKCANKYIHNK